MVFGIMVIGPAGVGKTTLCHSLQVYGRMNRRGIYAVNLDPAAEHLPYEPDIDIRDLITVTDAMTELNFGPNGGLIYCMEYLLQHLEWLQEKIEEFGPEDTLLIDCPGQLELYTHVPAMPDLVRALQMWGVTCCSAFLVDAVSLHEPSKFVASALAGLSAMLTLPIPNITVLSKADLVESKKELDDFLEVGSASLMVERCDQERAKQGRKPHKAYARLTSAICSILDDHSMLSFLPFSAYDEESPSQLIAFADHLTQYSEQAEVHIPRDDECDGMIYDKNNELES